MRAIWNGAVIADSTEPQRVDGYTYFPADKVDRRYLRASEHHSVCGWKGTASYYDLHIEGWIGFWRGVELVA